MILCVEDDSNIRDLIVYTLNTTGLETVGVGDGNAFFKVIEKEIPELVLLDIMLPGEDGISILKKIKANSKTKDIPVIVVSAKGAEYDKVLGLDEGADDYVTKPFGMLELVARVKAVLRRVKRVTLQDELYYDNIKMDLRRHEISVNGVNIILTLKEFELLRMLMENKETVLTRDRLLEEIWGYDFDGETRTVDVHVRTLRQKLGDAGELIKTVRGVGYMIGGSNES